MPLGDILYQLHLSTLLFSPRFSDLFQILSHDGADLRGLPSLVSGLRVHWPFNVQVLSRLRFFRLFEQANRRLGHFALHIQIVNHAERLTEGEFDPYDTRQTRLGR